VLGEMFGEGVTNDESGGAIGFTASTSLSADTAEALYSLVLANRPSVVIEIGMAFGVSSLAILAALQRAGTGGRLISIDPYQSKQFKGAGVAAVQRAGFKEMHRMLEEFDYIALPKLLGSGERTDFAFIDGWHTFDYTLLDFWYLDKMLDVGGIVGFDDCPLPAVDKTIQFVQSHRKYEELKIGFRTRFKPLSPLNHGIRRLMGRQLRIDAHRNRYFRKDQEWEPDWDYFSDF
jgi:predicted O-methyltransferase YrrM